MSDAILETLETIRKDAEGDTVTFGKLLDDIQERGYGPLIMVLSAFVILPTGMIPGVPAFVGIALLLIAGQMFLGRAKPWFPQRLKNIDLDTDKIKTSVDKARPWAEKLGKLLSPRLTWATKGTLALQVAAGCIAMAAFMMVPLGFIPFLPMILGAACLLIGLGITSRDGAVALAGYAVFLIAFVVAAGQAT